MRFKPTCLTVLALTASLSAGAALSQEFQLDDLHVANPFALPAPPGAHNGAAYVAISVEGDSPATLVGATSPVGDRVEIHDMVMEGDMMKMRRVDKLTVEPGDTLIMRPGGGYHLMLLGLQESLTEGDSFPMTLEFAERGELDVEVKVQTAEQASSDADEHYHQ
ncbi:copper chaperone PCu(A)C [Pistricoccus aurantiacus]|uniref:Copper chaperone PCu(A)C n=1 Tax=Pistricoccus aurantiacus TaxID=1883414 RepID=A0A5B8SNB9_9GAMM|nr:copper chaperone PCu(A)C [Pistricoccus aurantiacus]QEA37761.1 copper chaperone PCu(A)C [Pistricoccus aurantiacus]